MLRYTIPAFKIFQIYSHGVASTELRVALVLCSSYGCRVRKQSLLARRRVALLNYKEFLKLHKKSVVESSLSSWVNNPNSNCCEWECVTCDPASGRVTHLDLHSLYGVVSLHPHEFASHEYQCFNLNFLRLNFSLFMPFKELRSLDLSFNYFNDAVLTQDKHRK